MVNIQKSGDSAIKFTFTDNDRYLYDGEITVPLNSLILVLDESDMVVIKKVDGDVFLTFLIDNTNFSTKAELEEWFKENACGGTGGSSSGVTEEWVEEYVSESISGKADTSDVQNVASDVATVSGDVNTLSGSVNTLTGNVNTISGDVSSLSGDVANKADTTAVTASINAAVSGKMDTSAFNTYSASTDARISEDEEVTSAALNELNDALDDKADTTAVTESINAAVSGKADTSAVTASITAAVSGKQDTLVSGTNIKTINNESLLGSGNIDIQGGGKAIEAGRGIAITTGATADTVSFDLPISAQTNTTTAMTNNLVFYSSNTFSITGSATQDFSKNEVYGDSNSLTLKGYGGKVIMNYIKGRSNSINSSGNLCGYNFIYGQQNSITNNSSYNFLFGNFNTSNGKTKTSMIGEHLSPSNNYEYTFGQYNTSTHTNTTWGDSGNTLFSVGNGTADNARHNAFEIRQNGDIYVNDGTNDVRLQDTILALGGMKLVQISQSDYDLLPVKDPNTLYLITNVVS